ncbi:unnamed protein product [Clavelina lepadiformis]|uniref:Carbohydrate sulfotransferase n=1 Tax=Clavelina lepadiformis TaxID=159417 RepID=A0ABP0FDV9_CLALP
MIAKSIFAMVALAMKTWSLAFLRLVRTVPTLFPSCTLNQSLEGVFGCLGNYVGGYPYQDQGQCSYNVNDTIACLIGKVQECLAEGPSPVSPPDCYQFYHSTSACGQRKSWVCDFVQWKYQIITDWLPRFLAYSENNGIYASDLPGCPADFPDMCTNYDQRRCAERLGCRACFCADNLYKARRNKLVAFYKQKKLCFLVTCLMVVAMTSVCNLRSRNNKEKRSEVEKEQEVKETIKIHYTPSYEDTFDSRSLEIQERCKNRSQKVGSILSNTFKYNDDLKVVMCEVPKVASTTWQILLLRLGGFQANITKELRKKWAYSKIPNKHFKQLPSQTEALFRMTNYTTFFLTRHPFERLVSAYFDKLSNRSAYQYYKNVVGKQIAKPQAIEHLHGLHSKSCHNLQS